MNLLMRWKEVSVLLSSLVGMIKVYPSVSCLLAVNEVQVPRPWLDKQSYELIRLFCSMILGALILFFRFSILLKSRDRGEEFCSLILVSLFLSRKLLLFVLAIV